MAPSKPCAAARMLHLSRRLTKGPSAAPFPRILLPIRTNSTTTNPPPPVQVGTEDMIIGQSKSMPPPSHPSGATPATSQSRSSPSLSSSSPRYSSNRAPRTHAESILSNYIHPKHAAPGTISAPSSPSSLPTSSDADIPQSVRDLLPLLAAQKPHYITVHIHGRPYLVTQGDTIRLPFLMHGVRPGEVLRLNRATTLGSRDWTLRGGTHGLSKESSWPPDSAEQREELAEESQIIGNTEGLSSSLPRQGGNGDGGASVRGGAKTQTPQGVRRNQWGNWVDERLFVCRAVVMGTESEPMRVMEKTRRRQRKVKRVKSKHRYTVIRVQELRVMDGGGGAAADKGNV